VIFSMEIAIADPLHWRWEEKPSSTHDLAMLCPEKWALVSRIKQGFSQLRFLNGGY